MIEYLLQGMIGNASCQESRRDQVSHPSEKCLADVVSAGVETTAMNAEEFRRLRLASGMTQKLTGEVLGVTSKTIGRWEKGQASIGVLEAIGIRTLLAQRINGENEARQLVGQRRLRRV